MLDEKKQTTNAVLDGDRIGKGVAEARCVNSLSARSVRCEPDPKAVLSGMSVNDFDILRIEMR
jgi:hypothetical protein